MESPAAPSPASSASSRSISASFSCCIFGLPSLSFHTITNVLPTLADVLRLDAVRRGEPRVVAGADRLDARVRWVHSAEVTDIAHLLRGGELVLTTGIALPDEPGRLRRVRRRAGRGRRQRAHRGAGPQVRPRTARRAGLRRRGVRPAADRAGRARRRSSTSPRPCTPRSSTSQLAELRASEQLHEVFTQLSVDGAPPADVIRQVARLAGRPVVLENLSHQVLAATPPDATRPSCWPAGRRAPAPYAPRSAPPTTRRPAGW